MTVNFTVPRWVLKAGGVLGVLLVFVVASADSCGSANSEESGQVGTQQDIYTRHQPVPTFQYSAEREELIQLYEQRVSGSQNTWSVAVANNGDVLFSCPSKGFAIPYGTELTNPQRVDWGSSSAATVSQMDPNGLYPTSSAAGTWVMCLDPDGTTHPEYLEPNVMTFTKQPQIQNGRIVGFGASTPQSAIHVTQGR